MTLVLLSFLAIFLVTVSIGFLLFYRQAILQRLSTIIAPRKSRPAGAVPIGASIEAFVQPFQRVLPRSIEEVSVIQKRLIRAGYRKESHVNVFYGTKVLVPLLLCILVVVTGAYKGGFLLYVVAAGLGFLAPDFALGKRIKARKEDLRIGLPDALDLIVICVEAGLSLDQAILRTSEELRLSQPAISDELGLVNLELKAGRPRSDAWKQLAERTDVDTIRALVGIIIQADQFGTSVGKVMRGFADSLRTKRRQDAEEQAAKTTVKLVFPLVVFIFPSLFVVTLGPSMLVMFEAFDKFFSH